MDDFGSGSSRVAYLKKLPVDEIKIDKGVVRALATDVTDTAIVTATVALGPQAVAEGIEDRAAEGIEDRVAVGIGWREWAARWSRATTSAARCRPTPTRTTCAQPWAGASGARRAPVRARRDHHVPPDDPRVEANACIRADRLLRSIGLLRLPPATDRTEERVAPRCDRHAAPIPPSMP